MNDKQLQSLHLARNLIATVIDGLEPAETEEAQTLKLADSLLMAGKHGTIQRVKRVGGEWRIGVAK